MVYLVYLVYLVYFLVGPPLYGTCNLIVQKINEVTLLWRGRVFSVNQTPSIRKEALHSYSAVKCLGVRATEY